MDNVNVNIPDYDKSLINAIKIYLLYREVFRFVRRLIYDSKM